MLCSSVSNPSSPPPTSNPVAPDERRPWHYPDPWSGVVWLPNDRAPRPPLEWSARALIHAIARLFACMMIGATLFMSAVTIFAAAALAIGGA